MDTKVIPCLHHIRCPAVLNVFVLQTARTTGGVTVLCVVDDICALAQPLTMAGAGREIGQRPSETLSLFGTRRSVKGHVQYPHGGPS